MFILTIHYFLSPISLVIVQRVSCPLKNVWEKIAVQLKSHGESEIACN